MHSSKLRFIPATHFSKASGEGLGFLVSKAVTNRSKYFAILKRSNSSIRDSLGTERIVTSDNLALFERVFRVTGTLGIIVVSDPEIE